MDKQIFESAQKINKIKNNIKKYKKKCVELQEQLPAAMEQEEKFAALQYSEDARERGKYVDAHCKRVLIQSELRNCELLLTIEKYELDKLTTAREEFSQNQPEQ